ncbi:hypothetical protein AOQ84DRAFT_370426 [Glonium stellatum]|uniref:Uncharacterized protein n=1 Tax=Glonium stellatum TaxID=574774 RepID=A0A8E2JZE5_9PEZI|nr:hypothetical protein AOQ84DRAFT_370426 [Glonium stellatum]
MGSELSERSLVDGTLNWMSITPVHILTYHRHLQKSKRPASLFHLVLTTQHNLCTNPRDKIYGVWALAKDSRDLELEPDYSKPLAQVYIDFVKAFVSHHKSLDIICATQHASPDIKLPSWCPDWRHKPIINTLIQRSVPPLRPVDVINYLDKPLYYAARGTQAATGFFFDDSTLVCVGICADTVEHVGPELDQQTSLEDWRTIARKLSRRNGNMLTTEEADEQFASILMGDAGGGWNGDFKGNGVRVTVRPHSYDDDMYSPEEKAMLMIPQQRLIITKRGFMGLAMAHVEVGMHVCILLGCSVPVLLEKHSNHYHFKGSCYIQGWMKGEILDEMGGSDEDI